MELRTLEVYDGAATQRRSQCAKVSTVLEKMKIPLLTAAILVATAIGALARTGGVSDGHAQQQFLAYGGHDFDRPTDALQSKQHAVPAAFIMSSAKRLERRQQLQLRSAQAGLFGAAKPTNGPCGHGRYRDSTTAKCHGPADIED
jgi:hypothetical protein